MKGNRALTDQEVVDVYNVLGNKRDKCMFMLGIKSGLRISELLSLEIKDVTNHGELADYVTVAKKNTKGKLESKTLPLTNDLKAVLKDYLGEGPYDLGRPLFKSSVSLGPIKRITAIKILKKAFGQLKLQGKLSSHCLRKTFARKVHEALGNKIEMTQIALGHKNLSSTASYIQVDREKVEDAIRGLG